MNGPITFRQIVVARLPAPSQIGNVAMTDELLATCARVLTPGWVMAEIRSRSRDPELTQQRRRLVFVLTQMGCSTPAIGQIINRHHTTVLYLGRRRHRGAAR
jgi:chromosomal replication initiation ATPase DnaA